MKNTTSFFTAIRSIAAMRSITIIAMAAVIMVSMTGCDTDGDGGGNHALIGTWIKGSDSLTFGPDTPPASNQIALDAYSIGSSSGSGSGISLKIAGDAVTYYSGGAAFNFALNNNNNTLVITNGEDFNWGLNINGTWTRQ